MAKTKILRLHFDLNARQDGIALYFGDARGEPIDGSQLAAQSTIPVNFGPDYDAVRIYLHEMISAKAHDDLDVDVKRRVGARGSYSLLTGTRRDDDEPYYYDLGRYGTTVITTLYLWISANWKGPTQPVTAEFRVTLDPKLSASTGTSTELSGGDGPATGDDDDDDDTPPGTIVVAPPDNIPPPDPDPDWMPRPFLAAERPQELPAFGLHKRGGLGTQPLTRRERETLTTLRDVSRGLTHTLETFLGPSAAGPDAHDVNVGPGLRRLKR